MVKTKKININDYWKNKEDTNKINTDSDSDSDTLF